MPYTSAAADMWSLGVVVYEILTLKVPFYGTSLNCDSDTAPGTPSGDWVDIPDMKFLIDYCWERVEFRMEDLESSRVSKSAIEFVKQLLTADPRSRLTTAGAIHCSWLLKDTYEERLLQTEPYRLETTFDGDNVVHTTYMLNPSTGKKDFEIKQKWTWERLIGQGTFGAVHLEKEETSGQTRAVKVLSGKSGVDYSRELSLLAKLADVSSSTIRIKIIKLMIGITKHHNSFVEFLGWYKDRHSIFIVMEYIEHGDLSQYLGNSSIKKDAKDITRQLLQGLAILHEQSICHRDLKPQVCRYHSSCPLLSSSILMQVRLQNVLVACKEPIWVKITDFGISKDEKETLLQTSCGTPGYLAPELVMRRDCYTNAVDIWALGCLLYQILTSELPFLRTSIEAGVSENETGVVCALPSPELDIELLINLYNGKEDLPTDALKKYGVDNRAIGFLKRLLVANPNLRISATDALKSPWLFCDSSLSLQVEDEQEGDTKVFPVMENLQELCAGVKTMKRR